MGICDPPEKRALPVNQMNHFHRLSICETSNAIIVGIDKKRQVSPNRRMGKKPRSKRFNSDQNEDPQVQAEIEKGFAVNII